MTLAFWKGLLPATIDSDAGAAVESAQRRTYAVRPGSTCQCQSSASRVPVRVPDMSRLVEVPRWTDAQQADFEQPGSYGYLSVHVCQEAPNNSTQQKVSV